MEVLPIIIIISPLFTIFSNCVEKPIEVISSPGTNPGSVGMDLRLTDQRCRFRKLQIWYRSTGFFDQSSFGIDWTYLKKGRSVICRMICRLSNKLKSLQIDSVYPIFSSIHQLVSNPNWTSKAIVIIPACSTEQHYRYIWGSFRWRQFSFNHFLTWSIQAFSHFLAPEGQRLGPYG